MALLAIVWWLQRQGRRVPERTVSRAVGVSAAVLLVLAAWARGDRVAQRRRDPATWAAAVAVFSAALSSGTPRWLAAIAAIAALAAGLGFALPALGGVDVLSQVAVDLVQPRIRNLTRIARLVGAFSLAVTASFAFFLVWLVPEAQRGAWVERAACGRLARAGRAVVARRDRASSPSSARRWCFWRRRRDRRRPARTACCRGSSTRGSLPRGCEPCIRASARPRG